MRSPSSNNLDKLTLEYDIDSNIYQSYSTFCVEIDIDAGEVADEDQSQLPRKNCK